MTDAETRPDERTREEAAEPVVRVEGNGSVPEELDLAAIIAERDDLYDQLQRSRAEFLNLRRRTEQERTQIRQVASHAILSQLVPVADDLRRALESVPADQRETPLGQGVHLIERKFWGVLERSGVEEIKALGQPFDPSLHEAVDSVPGSASTTVVAVYQPGYKLGNSLLRPAMVKVGDANESPGAEGKSLEAEGEEPAADDEQHGTSNE